MGMASVRGYYYAVNESHSFQTAVSFRYQVVRLHKGKSTHSFPLRRIHPMTPFHTPSTSTVHPSHCHQHATHWLIPEPQSSTVCAPSYRPLALC